MRFCDKTATVINISLYSVICIGISCLYWNRRNNKGEKCLKIEKEPYSVIIAVMTADIF